jgi:hypothetical protein
MSKRSLAWIFAIGSLLRLSLIGLSPAWYDENFTVILSRLPFGRMLTAVAGDVHPPLYYLLIWPLGQLHAPIWVLRIPGALLSISAVWLFYRVLQEFDLPVRVQKAALILMAIMPIQLYYAQEARMYTLLEFLALAACLAMLQRRWCWFGVLCTLMLYTQYYAIFYIAALGLVALIRVKHFHTFEGERKVNFEEYRQILLNLMLAGLLFLPWLFVLLKQMHTISGSYWMQFTGVGMALRVLFENLLMPPQNAVIQIPLMLVCFAWLIGALIYVILHRPNNLGSILWLAFLPFGLAILVSLLWQPVLHYRPLIGISPFLYILLAVPVEALFEPLFNWDLTPSKNKRLDIRKALFAAIFILPLILVPDGSMFIYLRDNKTPSEASALQYIQTHWHPGDIIYAFDDDAWVNLQPNTSLPLYKAPDCGLTMGGLSPITRSAVGQVIRPLTSLTYQRAWLFWSDSPLAPTCGLTQLTALGLDLAHPLLVTEQDEFVFSGLWLFTNPLEKAGVTK